LIYTPFRGKGAKVLDAKRKYKTYKKKNLKNDKQIDQLRMNKYLILKPTKMKHSILTLSIIVIILSMTSCASVKFYSGSNLKNETGLRFYTVKPYLLVELKSEKDNTIKTSVVFLPDLSNPQYIILKPGFGSNEIKMAFTNSSLNSYGLVSESQIPETINSIAALVSKSADAVTQFSGPPTTAGQSQSSEIFKLYEIIFSPDGTTMKEVTDKN